MSDCGDALVREKLSGVEGTAAHGPRRTRALLDVSRVLPRMAPRPLTGMQGAKQIREKPPRCCPNLAAGLRSVCLWSGGRDSLGLA